MDIKKFKPFYLNLTGFTVTIFGGGSVGARRAKYFLSTGSRVRVIAKEFSDDLKQLKDKVELIEVDLKGSKNLVEKFISDSDIVVVATNDPDLNDMISSIAKSRGKLVNNAAEAMKGNVIVPFSGEVYNGLLKITVTSLGLSGIAARRARDKILKMLENDSELKTLFLSMALIKNALKACVKQPKIRLSIYFAIESSREYINAVSRGDIRGSIEEGIQVVETLLGRDIATCIRGNLIRYLTGSLNSQSRACLQNLITERLLMLVI